MLIRSPPPFHTYCSLPPLLPNSLHLTSLLPLRSPTIRSHPVDLSTPSQASFAQAKTWVQTLRRQADPSITIILVGNKLDLASSSRGTDRELAQAYAEEEGLLFVEASAKTGENVQEVFMQVVSPGRWRVGLDGIVIMGTTADPGRVSSLDFSMGRPRNFPSPRLLKLRPVVVANQGRRVSRSLPVKRPGNKPLRLATVDR
jgi:hypothetical protein